MPSDTGNTVKRMNFVLSIDVKNSDQGLEMVKDAIEFLAITIKKKRKRSSWWSPAGSS